MTIKTKNYNICNFGAIKAGAVFRHGNNLYMKTTPAYESNCLVNAVFLNSGVHMGFCDGEKITIVKGCFVED